MKETCKEQVKEPARKIIITIDPGQGGHVRGKQWAKIVRSVDRSRTNGYCFEGDFVRINQAVEIEVPAFLLTVSDEGSTKYHTVEAYFYKLKEDGTMDELLHESGFDYALKMRDKVADIIEKSTTTQCSVCGYTETGNLDAEISNLARDLRMRVMHKLDHPEKGEEIINFICDKIRDADY